MAEKLHEFDPDWVVPTSEMLREWLGTYGLSTRVAAAACYAKGEARDWATRILDGVLADDPVTGVEARVLSAVTRISEAFWMAFEHNYRTGLAAGKTVVGRRD